MPDFLDGIEEFLESFSPEEVAVTRAIFRNILAGRATQPKALPELLDMLATAVEAALVRLIDRGTVTADPETGALIGARGLSLMETPHRLVLNGRGLYAFCAVDAVGIPAALEGDAEVQSRCHSCGASLALTLTKGVMTEAPAGVVVWATERDLSRPLHRYT